MRTRLKSAIALLTIGASVLALAGCGGSTSSGNGAYSSGSASASTGETSTKSVDEAATNDTMANAPVCESTAVKGADEYDQDDIGTHVFIYGHVGADGQSIDIAGEVLGEIISQKTDGKMTVEVYDSGQLGTEESLRYDCIDGALDFYASGFQSYETAVPEMSALCMPFLYNTVDEMKEYLVDNDELFDKISGYMDSAGFTLLPFQAIGWRQVSTNKEITGIDSFNGMAMRIPTVESYIKLWNTIGASTTAINSSELFLALQQGMVDGQENPYDQIYTYGFGEVQKYITNSRHIQFLQTVTMSKNVFEGLTETEQQVIMDAGAEMAEYVTKWASESQDYFFEALQNDYGMIYIDFDEIDGMREALREKTYKPMYDEIKHEIESAGGDVSFLDYYLKDVRGVEIPS